MENYSEKQEGSCYNFSVLLELSAFNNLIGFKRAVEDEGHDIDEESLWYGRRIGSKKMGYEVRTPLTIAAMYGSKDVLVYILETGCVDVNRACGSDRVTALHCAVAGGSSSLAQIIKFLLDSSADTNIMDANGNRAIDLIAPYCFPFNSRKKILEAILKGSTPTDESLDLFKQMDDEPREMSTTRAEKKEYPVDLSLPDIKNGMYSTDEFRMYTFKVKPCSRAYSHDWTECPFVHPGENARRRDPRKYHYSCVPCPEFRKGSCRQGDACEYAHGIFECWLHPAQYRTRLCKDETGCNRRVCFFAHKPEELRPLYASTGSAVSPRSFSATSSLDMSSISPLGLGPPNLIIPPISSSPMSPSGVSSPMGSSMWSNQPNITSPTVQLPSSRLKASLSARDMDLDLELLGIESSRRRQQRLVDELSSLSSQSGWNNGLSTASGYNSPGDITGELSRLGRIKPTNLEDMFGSLDNTILSHSPNPHLRSSYPTNNSFSSARLSHPYGIDSYRTNAAASLSSRLAAFSKRSQSFIERGSMNHFSGVSSSPSAAPPAAVGSILSDWGSPDGKVEWGIQGEELNKLRKSSSFGVRNSGRNFAGTGSTTTEACETNDPDVSWVQSLVKDGPALKPGQFGFEEEEQQICHLDNGGSENLLAWMEQIYMEQEQLVA